MLDNKTGVEEVLCAECDTPIPPARVKLLNTKICVDCMTEMEKDGRGTVRHRMSQVITSKNGEEVDEIENVLVRGT